ncbi:MAG: CrcB family protein [Acidimicrobiales bacterium]
MIVGLSIAALSGVGSVLRFVVDRALQRRVRTVFPTGTLAVNSTAAFAIGLVSGLAAHHGAPATAVKLSAVGFLGGYSTFSTWTFETLALGESGALLEAGLNVAGTFVLALFGAAAGYGVGSL